MKRVFTSILSFALIIVLSLSCVIPTFAATRYVINGKEHFFNSETNMNTKYTYSNVVVTSTGKVCYSGWVRQSPVQSVAKGESSSIAKGTKYTVTKTLSATLTGNVLGTVESKIGCTAEWKKETFSVTVSNSAKNKTNKLRYIAYFTSNKYKEYKVTYQINKYRKCTLCGQWVKVKSTKMDGGYVYKMVGTNGGFFYSDTKSALQPSKNIGFKKNGVRFASGKFLTKGGKSLPGWYLTKDNQNFNAFSDIRYWG